MPMQRFRRAPGESAPSGDDLARAIRNIDKRLDLVRVRNQPVPMKLYRARRILHEAQQRCREPAALSSLPFDSSAHAGAPSKTHRPRRGPVERHEALPGLPRIERLDEPQDFTGCLLWSKRTGSPLREWNRDVHAYERKSMAYDWTGEATRKRNRLKLASAVLLSIGIVLGIPAALAPFF